ncbi:MAG: DNA cytosine methyltransferase [Bacteroidota bacterium]
MKKIEKNSNKNKPTYIDLFAGCGGLSLGLHQSGWRGLFAIEKSPQAFETLEYNLIRKLNHFEWPDWLPCQPHDINEINKIYRDYLKKINGHVDLVAGGPPCQGFSYAGKRIEGDERNKLIKSYLTFVKVVKPRFIFFENVKGFTTKFVKNKSKGKAYSEFVLKSLRKEYLVKGEMIDFSEFGIPQKRTRFILVGIRKDFAKQRKIQAKSFFEKISQNKEDFLVSKRLSLKTNLKQAISDLLYENGTVDCPDRRGFKAGIYSRANTWYQQYMRKNVASANPDSHSFVNHRKETENKFKFILQYGNRNKHLTQELMSRLKINKHRVVPLDEAQPSITLTTLPDDHIHYQEPRVLTVREYARIQSFPDWFELKSKYTTGGDRRTTEVPRYSQVGNAIPPLFGEQSGLVLKQLLNGRSS